MKNIVTVIFFALALLACKSKHVSDNTAYNYNYHDFKRAFEDGDTTAVIKVINELNDTMEDRRFYVRVLDLWDVTGFTYGLNDTYDEAYISIPANLKIIYKKNIVTVFQLYKQSCFFMKDSISSEDVLDFQDRYGHDTTVYTKNDIHRLSIALDSLCTE